MNKGLFYLFMLFFSSSLFAFELNGVMSDNRDGTYAVTLNEANDNVYVGSAVLMGDGTITISVVDQSGEFYIGVGRPVSEGSYLLKLRSNNSGDYASGVVVLD